VPGGRWRLDLRRGLAPNSLDRHCAHGFGDRHCAHGFGLTSPQIHLTVGLKPPLESRRAGRPPIKPPLNPRIWCVLVGVCVFGWEVFCLY
jgi:hypothetical protein